MMTKKFLEHLKAHPNPTHRPLIIHIASCVSDIRNPFTSAFYQATKTSNKIFAHTTYYPQSQNVDYLIIKPGWVATNMTKKDVNSITTSVAEESSAILKSIGYTRDTYAHPKHLGMMFGINILPSPVYAAFV